MAKLNVRKMRLIFLQKDSRDLLGELQRLGAAELIPIEDERLGVMSAKSSVTSIERDIHAVEECLEAMNKYSPESGGIGSLFTGRHEIGCDEYFRVADSADGVLKSALEVVSLSKRISDMKAEIEKCETGLEMLSVWEGLDIPMTRQRTSKTVIFTGTFPEILSADSIRDMIEKSAPDAAFDRLTCP